MSHTIRGKTKLLNRVHRIRGQVEAIERALEAEVDCADVIQRITSLPRRHEWITCSCVGGSHQGTLQPHPGQRRGGPTVA